MSKKAVLRLLLCIALIFQLAACHSISAKGGKISRAHNAINICIMKTPLKIRKNLLKKVDHAYAYIKEETIYVTFYHGSSGLFDTLNKSDRQYLGCEVSYKLGSDVIYLAEPLKRPIIQKRKYLGTASGSIVAAFVRENGGFKFVKMKLFDLQDFYKNNPDYKNNPSID